MRTRPTSGHARDARRLAAGAGVLAQVGGLAVAVAAAGPARTAAVEEPPPRPARPVAAPPPAPVVRIAAVGDVTLGRDGSLPADGGEALLAGARPHLVGDVVLGNLETALTDRGAPKCAGGDPGCYAFRAPPASAAVLRRAGFTVLNLANNHALDYGPEGLADTVEALRRAGLRHTGRPGELALVRVGPLRVAVVGLAHSAGLQSALDLPAAQALVRRAGEAADLVVVTAHVGAEGSEHRHVRPGGETYLGEPRGDPVALAHAVVDAGADLVAFHGPHVLRALEWYRGRLIAYSLGNFSSHGTLATTGHGGVSAVLQVALRADGTLATARVVPLRLVGPGEPVPDPARVALAELRELSGSDRGPAAPRIAADGSVHSPR